VLAAVLGDLFRAKEAAMSDPTLLTITDLGHAQLADLLVH
jgi:hypothetical protein